MVVKFNGKKLVGEATTSQRVTLHFLTGKDTRNLKISKAEASKKISELSAKKATNGKAKFSNKVADGQATTSQRVWLARLEHKTNYGEKISFAQAQKRLSKLMNK